MTPNMETKRKLKSGAVWLWCIGEGYEEAEIKETFIDAVFSKDDKTTGFIFEFDKNVNELLFCIEKAKEKVQYIYIVIDDNSKYQKLKNILPEYCGVFSSSNAFGLGMATQIIKQAAFISKESGK